MTAQVEVSGDVILLKGDLLFSTILSVRETLTKVVTETDQAWVVDFAGVRRVDSSAVSLWLCLQRAARGRQLSLKAVNIPAELHSIVSLVGLEHTGLNP